MDATEYTKDLYINWLVGGQEFPANHGSVYLGLHTDDPGPSGENNEVSASDYSRKEVAVSDWTIGTGTFENPDVIEFDIATSDWGTITHFSIWDGPDATDNSLGYSPLASNVTINTDDTAVFRSGKLTGEFS